MATVITAASSHGAGSNHANSAPPDIPIEPRRKETPEEHRARMEAKSARLRRFATGERAAETATYNASVRPREEEPELEDEPVVESDVADDKPVAAPAPAARPVPAPPRSPARRPTQDEQRNLAIVTAYVQGDSLRDLATRFHLGQASVRTVLVDAGVQLRAQGQRADRVIVEAPGTLAEEPPVVEVEVATLTIAVPDEAEIVPPAPTLDATVTFPAAAVEPPAESEERTRRPITDSELAQMVADYEGGKTPPEIADATGRTPKTVRVALQRAGVQMRDDRALRSGGHNRLEVDQAVVEEVRRLYVDEGLSQAVVADRMDLPLKAVQKIMARHGIETRPDAAGIKRDRAPEPEPERTVRYRDPAAAARVSTADVGPALTPPEPSTIVPAERPMPATFHVETAVPSLDEALAAAGQGVRALLAAIEDLTTAAVRVHEARVAAAHAAVAGIRRDANQLLAALGEPTEGAA